MGAMGAPWGRVFRSGTSGRRRGPEHPRRRSSQEDRRPVADRAEGQGYARSPAPLKATVRAMPLCRVSIDVAAAIRDVWIVHGSGRKTPQNRVRWVRPTLGASRAPGKPDGFDRR